MKKTYLNEDEEILLEIVGEEKFLEIQKRFGGRQFYIQRPGFFAIQRLTEAGKSRREIIQELRISASMFYKFFKK
jgi:hypothetical protein